MYIEDGRRPFLVLEKKMLTKEEFFLSRRYAEKYFFGGRIRHGFGVMFIAALVISLLATAATIISRPASLNYQNILVPVFLFLFGVILLVVFPNRAEKRIQKAYQSGLNLQKPYHIRFCKEYFEWENENEYIKIARTDIEKCLETNQMFLLKRNDGALFTIMKNWITGSDFILLKDYLYSVYACQLKTVK